MALAEIRSTPPQEQSWFPAASLIRSIKSARSTSRPMASPCHCACLFATGRRKQTWGQRCVAKRSDLYQLRSREQAVNQDVRNAVNKLEESKLAIEAAKTARDLAQKTLAAKQRKYELGAQTIFFVLDAQNVLEQEEQNYVQSTIGYQKAIASASTAPPAIYWIRTECSLKTQWIWTAEWRPWRIPALRFGHN